MKHTKHWSSIMQQIDRLYWKNQTSEGRINCITDYIVRMQESYQFYLLSVTAIIGGIALLAGVIIGKILFSF
jgi:hypothetical protein